MIEIWTDQLNTTEYLTMAKKAVRKSAEPQHNNKTMKPLIEADAIG